MTTSFKDSDVFSLLLFAVYKLKDKPEYASLSELAYVLDRHNLLNLCEYFGGLTITIPTIEDLELMLQGLYLYQLVDINGLPMNKAYKKLTKSDYTINELKEMYGQIKTVLDEYKFQPRNLEN